ncbi:alanine racemase [Paenibacillus cymbidii]|uniref:alanine racemase n=1 Tax=Paenibacillus cymbidii TaxID=1639034 RepID=UPI001436BD25|nr:alanine racemase [Paenibacillus cymbidii]
MINQSELIQTLDTPAVVIDLDALDGNLRRTAERAARSGVKLRPHTKTHKSVWVAKKQLEYGACGITVAKLGEAEVMAAAGIDDILLAYPIVGKRKLERLGKLLGIARITVSTDNYEVAQGISELGVSLGKRIPLYVDVNTGLGRLGKEPGAPTADLVERIASLPGVEVTGLMTHSGHAYGKGSEEEILAVAIHEAQSLLTTKELLRQRGIDVREVSVGSTPTSKFALQLPPGVTEMRPGAYVYGDVSQLVTHTMEESQCAMRVFATVVGLPRPGTVVIDAGSKTLTTDVNGARKGYGLLPAHPDVIVERLSEEHGNLTVPEGTRFHIGDVVEIIPNHCCTVTNLHDRLIGVRDGRVERYIQVDGRGKIN